MKVELKSIASGRIDWLEVRDKNGKLKTRLENIPNLLFNNAFAGGALGSVPTTATTYGSTLDSYEDLGGTWNQTGNTVTRATGTAVFPSSPSHIGNELYWYDAGANTGHRCHVNARASDTSITVSGVAKSITGGKIRRFLTNAGSYWGSVAQTSSSGTVLSTTVDSAAGTKQSTCRINFPSAVSGYSLGSIIIGSNAARIKLPSPVTIDAEDQIQFEYTWQETVSGRVQTYELGAESVGIPQKHSMISIVGNGTNVDVTFSAATHFLAGDKLDLRGVTTKKAAISSASSTSTTFTINTATAHGLNPGDSVTIENASVAGYNGVFTVATVVDADTFTITDAANPGAMGASGTARLTTPATYFDDLGLATIASMVSSSVARITSAITGPDVEPVAIGGDPGVRVGYVRDSAGNTIFQITNNGANRRCRLYTEANVRPLVDDVSTFMTTGTGLLTTSEPPYTSAQASNDFTTLQSGVWNAGVGTSINRCKQAQLSEGYNGGCQITFNTPFNKTEAQRLTIVESKQIRRTLDLTGI